MILIKRRSVDIDQRGTFLGAIVFELASRPTLVNKIGQKINAIAAPKGHRGVQRWN
jgi:hypothetical protein